ncbi:nucleotidyltransferase family protein [uncultured Methanoregula sp.]|uniref:nucleotidyltransferase family protein n=1 Tax=uncultured Methanoregula sp. TaxID=1005933 RepID=UPI002AAA6D4C|nr:nucleotidyltransferase family protein [uncultured Methanoregula sp.]
MQKKPVVFTAISIIYVECEYSLRKMRNTSEILDQLRSMRYELSEQYHVRSIGIFGSYSRKDQTEQSDLDLVVEFKEQIGLMKFVHLKDLIADRLNIRVDLVTPEGLHPLIRDQVMHEVVYV